MFKKILLILAALVGLLVVLVIGLCVYINSQPDEFTISRSITIDTPAATVFPYVNTLSQWQVWSPFEKLDPNMKRTFSGPESGIGSVYAWSGDKDASEGSMTITESKPNELILMDLKFIKPFPGTNLTTFTFKPEGVNQTNVTWTMSGTSNFFFKTMGVLVDCNKIVGGLFDEGLVQLKAVAEKK